MKSMLAGLSAAALISSGLVAAATTTAEAAPYPGTVATNCSVEVLSSTKKNTRVAVRVSAAGEGAPKGRVTVSVEHNKGRDSARERGFYDGGRLVLELGRLKTGRYDGRMFFNSMPPRSVYKNCGQGFSFRVTRR